MRSAKRGIAAGLTVLLITAAWATAALAKTIHVGDEYGISYLPLTVMRTQHLLANLAQKDGLNLNIKWLQFTGGAAMDEAMVSGNLDIAAAGVGPMVVLWARTRDNLKVRALCALNSMPLYLNTIDPNVHSIKDFTDKDRIAMPAAGVSIQAITLMMEAAKVFGPDHAKKLNSITVSMSHPDGMAALLTPKSGITAHLTSPPYQYEELMHPGVHRVLDSYNVLGGPATFNVIFAPSRFIKKNPKIGPLFVTALKEADAFIIGSPDKAAEIYIHSTHTKLTQAELAKMLKNPEIHWTIVPQRTMEYARFMTKIGLIKQAPASWKDLFFSTMNGEPGS